MNRIGFALLVLCAMAFGQAKNNYTAVFDTAVISDFRADSVKVTKAFPLSMYEDCAVIVLVDDSSSAGFASDSLKFGLGYQLGYVTFDSLYRVDTTWQLDSVYIDTIQTSKLGVGSMGTMDSTRVLAKGMHGIDTTNVPGWAVYSAWFVPEWAPLIRYFVKGETGNVTGGPLELIIQHQQRLFVNTQ